MTYSIIGKEMINFTFMNGTARTLAQAMNYVYSPERAHRLIIGTI